MTIHVYTPSTFAKLAPTLQPGDVVRVSGDLTQKVSGVKVPAGAPPVVFQAEPGARMGGWALISDCAGVTFRGFQLMTPTPFSVSGERIVLEDITAKGAGATVTGGTAVIVTGGDVTLRRWKVSDVCTLGSVQGASRVVLEDVQVDGIWGDGLLIAPAKGATVRLERVTFRRFTGGYSHRDAVQLMGADYRFEACGLVVDSSEGTPVQGVFTDNGSSIVMDIRDCAFFGGQWNAIYTSTAGPAPGSRIEGNFLQGRAEVFEPVRQVMQPRIVAPAWAVGKNTIAPLAKAGDRTALAAFLNPAPPTLEERVAALEAKVAALSAKSV